MIDCNVIRSRGAKVARSALYEDYELYCNDEGRPTLSKNGFYSNLREKGFADRKIGGIRYFVDIEIHGDIDNLQLPFDS